MSTTPRTDAAKIKSGFQAVPNEFLDFARTLETELAATERLRFGADADRRRLRADNVAAHQMACAAGLERDQLRAEVERLKKRIRDDNRAYGCELLDPNGTIWEQAAKDHARAERAEAELAAIKQGHGELGKYEQLRLKNAELHNIIERASVQFFHEGSDGEILTNMLTILNEAK